MKLRNKKTGDVREFESLNLIVRAEDPEDGFESWNDYHSLAELNGEWEDYKPAEPLIKNEKIRKIIRAWAEVNLLSDVLYDKDKDCIYSGFGLDDTDTSVCISFDDIHVYDELEPRKTYTITELCGEREE
jgi:hypothetical protein